MKESESYSVVQVETPIRLTEFGKKFIIQTVSCIIQNGSRKGVVQFGDT